MTPLMVISRTLGLGVLLLAACSVDGSKVHHNDESQYLVSVRICDIRSDPEKYVGSVVSLDARYKSDHMYYSYLLDKTCPSQQAIEVEHPLHTQGDTSVREFFSMEDEACAAQGGSVCPIDIGISVDVLVKRQPDGRKLIAEFKSVRDFQAP